MFVKELIISILTGLFIVFIPIYSMEGPSTSTGTIESSAFTNILIHFILVHSLIFNKVFLPPYSISLYKSLFLILQIGFYYIGLIIISEFDIYQYKGIIWYCLQGRIILTAIFTTWMIIGCHWVFFIFKSIWVSVRK